MGFKRKRITYKLDFTGTEYEGLEVKVRGLTTGEYLDLVGLSAPDKGDEAAAETERMLQMFAEHMVSWNLHDEDDKPVPSTYEGIKANDLTMNMYIINAWTEAIANVPEATEKKSSTGEVSLVASIPTETL